MVRDAEQFAEEDRQRREGAEGIGVYRDKAHVLTKYLDPIGSDGTPGIPEDRLTILRKDSSQDDVPGRPVGPPGSRLR
jgi:hypothetical protein